MKKLITTYVEYNRWANKRIAGILLGIDAALLDVEVKSSFSSLRKTILHIWDAELAWMARLTGESFTWPPTAQFVNPSIDAFVNTSESFVEYVKQQDELFLNSLSTYKDSRGNEHINLKYEMIMHCMNHTTFHRGQLITIMRELGVTNLISTDLITYLREKKQTGSN